MATILIDATVPHILKLEFYYNGCLNTLN